MTSTEEHWEAHYEGPEPRWSGRPNPVLVEVAGSLPPGTALDLGCGEGGDAVWLAQRGWRVTGVDVSTTALARAADLAERAGVADAVDLRRGDLADGLPGGPYDLVSAQYLHSTIDLPRDRILRAAAAVVAPGGTLLVVGHAEPPPWHTAAAHGPEHRLPSLEEVLAELALDPAAWRIDRADVAERAATGPDGTPATLQDSVVAARRTSG